jgi:GNAT superfamily N-acetyltransferase
MAKKITRPFVYLQLFVRPFDLIPPHIQVMLALHHHSPYARRDPSPLLTIRDLGPADEDLVDRIHTSLSSRSQYQRYHGAKPRLSPRERRFLAGADGRDHVALVAFDGGAPVAIARFVRINGRRHVADIAAEVVDARQRQGIGSDLVIRLARRAAALGIRGFTATVLSETGIGRSLIRRGWRVAEVDGPTTTLEVDVWTLLAAA